MERMNKKDTLRMIPPVNEILDLPETSMLIQEFGREFILESIRKTIEEYREMLNVNENSEQHNLLNSREDIIEYIVAELKNRIEKYYKSSLKRVINATGIVLHTNLGRAPLPETALKSMLEVNDGYSNLEFDLESGTRGSRNSHIEDLIVRITGAESAFVVNNNAAAVFLCLNTLAYDREVIVSRGQLVEIGGSFRIPDIISRSGANMVEVGTTNKTKAVDYIQAVNDKTSILLKVHTSNYKLVGFTEEVSLKQLIGIGKENDLIVMEDLGSGSLYDLSQIGLPYEPLVQDSIKNGVNLVTFSGDKLLGGPQAGIITGEKVLIDRIKKNPLARMVRCDKSTISALTAVLNLYLESKNIIENIPVLRMMSKDEETLMSEALNLKMSIENRLSDKCSAEIIDDMDEVGGGSLPGVNLKGKAVAVTVPQMEVNQLQARLRQWKNPIVSRIHKERLLLNVRTLMEKDYEIIVEAIAGILE